MPREQHGWPWSQHHLWEFHYQLKSEQCQIDTKGAGAPHL